MEKVSVIIPCYKVEQYLEACLQTLLAQTLQDLEFVFVDDGSPGETPAVLDSFKSRDPRVKVIHQENKGLGGARNTGILAARGEYIGFLDPDDILPPEYYETLYAAVRKYDADIAWTNIIARTPRGEEYYAKHTVEKVIVDMNEVVRDRSSHVMSKIYRRRLFEDKSLLFREHCYFEDIIFNFPVMFAANKIVTVPSTAYYYIFYPNSIAHRRQDKKLQIDKYNALAFARDFARERGFQLPKHLTKIRRRYILFGKYACLIKQRDYGPYMLWLLFDFIPVWYQPMRGWKKM